MQVEAIRQASVLKCTVVYGYLYLLQKWHTKEREREGEREAQLRSKQLLSFNLRKALWKVSAEADKAVAYRTTACATQHTSRAIFIL